MGALRTLDLNNANIATPPGGPNGLTVNRGSFLVERKVHVK